MTAKLREYREELYPPEDDEVCIENINMFIKFMYDRHMVWVNRFERGLPKEKWTDNKILKTYKYTNVYRQLDRGTLWALENIIQPFKDEIDKIDIPKDRNGIKYKEYLEEKKGHFKKLLWELMLYRLCNRIETFEKIGLPPYDKFNPLQYFKRMYLVKNKYHAPMTNAHLTCPCKKGYTKVDGYFVGILDAYFKLDDMTEKIMKAPRAGKVFDIIKKVENFGGFIAYEIYCDLCYAEAIPFTINDFVNVGPGAKEGIRIMFPSSSKKLRFVLDRVHDIFYEQDRYFDNLNLEFPYYNKYEPIDNKLSLRTIEHSLCEFSKYFLQVHDAGKRRLKYAKWSKHKGCKVDPDTGDTLKYNYKVYKKFFARSESMKRSKMFAKFEKSENKSKATLYHFVDKMKDKLKIK